MDKGLGRTETICPMWKVSMLWEHMIDKLRTSNQGRRGKKQCDCLSAPSAVQVTTIFSSQRFGISQNVNLILKERPDFMKDPRGILQRNFNHINVKLSFLGKKNKQLWVDEWERKRKKLVTVFTICGDA